jgi:protocatechuate 3,4-dioxygenase beta subunit
LPFVVLGFLLVAALGVALWIRSRRAPADSGAPPTSAASTTGAPRLRARAAHPPADASIAGRVIDATGAPVPGATVCANAGAGPIPFEQGEPTCVTSADDGHYQLKSLSPARFTLFASAPGHRPMAYISPAPARARFLDLREGEARAGVDFTLPRGGVEVRGQVKDVGGGAIAGALVMLHGWMGPAQAAAVTRTDAQGSFSAWTEEGHFMARASADGYADGMKDGIAPGPSLDISLTPGSVLVGRVVEAATGAPVADAKIDVGGEFGFGRFRTDVPTSDGDGRFRVSGLGPGRYKPTARVSGGYGQARASVVLGIGETSDEVLIELHPAYDVAARVEVSPGGGPCPSGLAGLMSPTANGMLPATLDPDGAARFEGVLPGSYEVMVHCPEHAADLTYPPVEVKDADVVGLVWTVRAGLSLRGRVVDREDKPVRAMVHAMPTEMTTPRPGAFTQSEDDGTFVLRGLLPGKLRVMANARDHISPEPVEVDLADDRAPELKLVVDSGGTLEGSVVDEDRRPVEGAEIMVMGQQAGGWGPPARSLADGTFVQKGLAPGEYRVSASKGGMMLRAPGASDMGPPGVAVTVKAGVTAKVQLVVERQGGELSGRVVDEGGKPVTDAFIEVVREQEGGPQGGPFPGPPPMARPSMMGGFSNAPVLTDPEGEFVVRGLSRGVYTVHAYRRGGGSGLVEHVKLGDTVSITIKRTGSIAGTLSAYGGAPPPDQFTLRLVNHAAPFFRHESFAFTEGVWSVSGLPEGKYELSIDAAEGTATAEVTLASGEDRTGVALTLSGVATVKGQVVSLEDGAPVAGMSVQVYPQRGMGGLGPSLRPSVTDAEGRFEATRVPAGPVTVVVMPSDPMSSAVDHAAMPAEVQASAVTDVGRIPVAKRRLKMGEMVGDLGFSLKAPDSPTPFAVQLLEVATVRADGPAATSGLRVGDRIVSVDGFDVSGKLAYLYGSLTSVREGTQVTLGLSRGGTVVVVAEKMPAIPDMPYPGMPPDPAGAAPASPAPPPPPPPPPPPQPAEP